MNPNELLHRIKAVLSMPLPGEEAQYRMAPAARPRVTDLTGARLSSVLILFYIQEDACYSVLILRNDYKGLHSGQVSFPGGKPEETDADLFCTALRETQEEIGLDTGSVQLLGELSHLYIPVSNFLVHPYVGFYPNLPIFEPDLREVRKIIPWRLMDLLDDNRVFKKEIIYGNGASILSPYFDIEGHTVWGATAMILSELKEVLRLSLHD